jgi:hypothetical protein
MRTSRGWRAQAYRPRSLSRVNPPGSVQPRTHLRTTVREPRPERGSCLDSGRGDHGCVAGTGAGIRHPAEHLAAKRAGVKADGRRPPLDLPHTGARRHAGRRCVAFVSLPTSNVGSRAARPHARAPAGGPLCAPRTLTIASREPDRGHHVTRPKQRASVRSPCLTLLPPVRAATLRTTTCPMSAASPWIAPIRTARPCSGARSLAGRPRQHEQPRRP